MAFVFPRCLPIRIKSASYPHNSLSVKCLRGSDIDTASMHKTLNQPVRVALTREVGKNASLAESLRMIYPEIEVVHVPCVETVSGADLDLLPEALQERNPAWIVITSPEAASIFYQGWKKANYPQLNNVAAVGSATAKSLQTLGITVNFEPSKATGKTLAREFPDPVGKEEVLYPASAKASKVIEDTLRERGYTVTRLNTYSTEFAAFEEQLKFIANGTHIVTFASPSAVKGWVHNVGVSDEIAVACIGETSAFAARKAGFSRVSFPENPGMEGWITAVSDAMKLFPSLQH